MAGHFIPFVKAAASLDAKPGWSCRPARITPVDLEESYAVLNAEALVVAEVRDYQTARLICHAVNYMLELMQQAGGPAECLMRAGQQQAGTEK